MILLKSLVEWKEHGSMWKSRSGRFGAKNKRGKVKYFKESERAHQYSQTGSTPSSEDKYNLRNIALPLIRKHLGGF